MIYDRKPPRTRNPITIAADIVTLDGRISRDLAYEAARALPAASDKANRLERDLAEVLDTLRELHDWQNGCPLPTYERAWKAAMAKSQELLAKHNV